MWLLCAIPLLFIYSDKELFFLINKNHNAFFDQLMTVFSAYGRGDSITIVFISLLIVPLFRNRVYLISTILFGIVLPLINIYSKDFFDKSRPIGEYSVHNVHTVPWLVNLYHDSFPSGHTMGAFGFFLILNHFMPANKWYISLTFFLLACACAYSRIYLGQHFFSDVVAGSLIGVLFSLLILIFTHFIIPTKQSHE